MYVVLKHAHSSLRWLVLFFLIWSIISAYKIWKENREVSGVPKVWLYGLIFVHIQLLLGIILYFLSPYVQFNEFTMSEPFYRFYAIEHVFGMLIAIVLVTIGYSRAKKKIGSSKPGKIVLWTYLIGLIVILISIPWPFRNLVGSWY